MLTGILVHGICAHPREGALTCIVHRDDRYPEQNGDEPGLGGSGKRPPWLLAALGLGLCIVLGLTDAVDCMTLPLFAVGVWLCASALYRMRRLGVFCAEMTALHAPRRPAYPYVRLLIGLALVALPAIIGGGPGTPDLPAPPAVRVVPMATPVR